MWYPAKAAVRAGRVGVNNNTEDNWNAANVGDYSAAFGKDTEASGEGALATGAVSTASGANAVAMGARSGASGGGALAVGYAAVASGDQSAAIGEYASADGSEAVAMGWGTTAATNQSLALGECNAANTSADGTLLVVGNGFFGTSDCNSTSDALTLDDQGNLTVSSQNTFSDRRLKTQIESLGDGVLGKLADLRPVRYEFKDQRAHPSGEQLGLIAQEVQNQFPELVGEGSDGMLSLAYPKLTAVLLKGLQEQQSTIEEQTDRLAKLETENEEQNQKIADLQERLAALEQSRSVPAGWTGGQGMLLIAFLLGGLLGAGLLATRRS